MTNLVQEGVYMGRRERAPRRLDTREHVDRKKESVKTGVPHIDTIQEDYDRYCEIMCDMGEFPKPFWDKSEWYAELYSLESK